MTTPHHNADLLRAIADGKQMQCHDAPISDYGRGWSNVSAEFALYELSTGLIGRPIRIKPASDTVLINGVECPAPMLKKPSYDSIYYMPAIIDLVGRSAVGFTWVGGSTDEYLFARGMCFATEDDAKAVAEAILKPLREYAARSNGEKE